MRSPGDWTTLLGAVALAAMLALLSPGVRAVRADVSASPAAASAPGDLGAHAPQLQRPAGGVHRER